MDTEKQSSQTSAPSQSNGATEENPARQAEQEMVFKLKGAIDQNGRYSYRLNDMATGFAAGRGVPIMSARAEIERSFARQFGADPKTYLEQHYDERRELAQENGQSRSQPSRQRSQGRGR